MKKNWYQILGVTSDAEPEVIKTCYRALARKFHPDNQDTGNEEKFKDLQAAWAVLSNPQLRAQFDQTLHQTQSAGQRQYQDAQRRSPFDFVDGVDTNAYPGAYTGAEIDLGAIARDVLTDAALEIGEGFLHNVVSQMSPFARKTFFEALQRRRAGKPGSQKAG